MDYRKYMQQCMCGEPENKWWYKISRFGVQMYLKCNLIVQRQTASALIRIGYGE